MIRLVFRLAGTVLWAFVVAIFSFYLAWAEGWAKDLDAYQGKK